MKTLPELKKRLEYLEAEIAEAQRRLPAHSVKPTVMHMLMNHPSFNELDLSRWKVLIGGSALRKSMCQTAMARGIDIFTGYGMSETCPILTVAHVHRNDLEFGEEVDLRCTPGRPIPLVELRLGHAGRRLRHCCDEAFRWPGSHGRQRRDGRARSEDAGRCRCNPRYRNGARR